MAKELDEGELRLPSGFVFNHEYFLKGHHQRRREVEVAAISRDCFSGAFPFTSARNQDLLPPLFEPANSVSCIGEEEEEEDYVAELTRRMAHSFLHDEEEEKKLFPWGHAKAPSVVAGGWPGSKKGRPNLASLGSSPALYPVEKRKEGEPLDLLSHAAEQVMRLRLSDLERRNNLYERDLLYMARKPSRAVAVPAPTSKNSGTGCFAGSGLSQQQQLQAAHFYRLKQLQLMKQQLARQSEPRSGAAATVGGVHGEGKRFRPPSLSPSSFQKAQAGSGNGMRAVFLNGTRKESIGTGVFLPRTPGSKNETPKKPACSTVLVPARVAQALNLNLEELGAESRFPAGFVLNHDALVDRTKMLLGQQTRNHLRLHPAAAMATGDISLPREWTY